MTESEAQGYQKRLEPFYDHVGRVVVGLRPLFDRLLIGLLSGGHVLVEGVPGLAKTLAVRSAAAALALQFSRIQFTADLLPSDLIGTLVLQPGSASFAIKRGPVFANILLADEINRAPAKVQSALLEAMQERQVTIGESTLALPDPFLVLATQNPIEHEGTYPLPEAQLDRFLMKCVLDYPKVEDEGDIIDRMTAPVSTAPVEPAISPAEVDELRSAAESVHVDVKIRDYVLQIVRSTRPTGPGQAVQYGAGPRASVGLVKAAKAHALIAGRGYVLPHDVKTLAPDVLRHRIVLGYEAEADGLTPDIVIERILAEIPMP